MRFDVDELIADVKRGEATRENGWSGWSQAVAKCLVQEIERLRAADMKNAIWQAKFRAEMNALTAARDEARAEMDRRETQVNQYITLLTEANLRWDAEKGKRGLEGWTWHWMQGRWSRDGAEVEQLECDECDWRWRVDDGDWTLIPSALEAMRAAEAVLAERAEEAPEGWSRSGPYEPFSLMSPLGRASAYSPGNGSSGWTWTATDGGSTVVGREPSMPEAMQAAEAWLDGQANTPKAVAPSPLQRARDFIANYPRDPEAEGLLKALDEVLGDDRG